MNQKEDFKKWLKLDSGDGKCVMDKLLYFYCFIEDYFKSEQIEIKIPFEIALIKFCWFCLYIQIIKLIKILQIMKITLNMMN